MKTVVKPRITTVTYKIDGVNIDVNYQTVSTYKDINPDELIVLLPGWSINAEAKSAMEIARAFSEISKRRVLIIDTKPSEIIKDTLFKESAAIKNLITKINAKKIIIAGYSEGGIKAINLTTIMQKHMELNIEGLVLMESMGLYDQNSKHQVIGGFIKDSLVDTPIAISKRVIIKRNSSSIRNGITAVTDVLFGFIKEIKRARLKYPNRMMSQIDEMIYKSKRLKDVTVPVILIQGINDPVSSPNKLIPNFDELDENTNYWERGSKNPKREEYLRKHVFTKSPYIRLLVGKIALPNHIMPFEDAKRIAKASLYLINEAKNK